MTTDKHLSLIPTDIAGVTSLAELFAKSVLIPDALRSKPADVLVTLLAGHELGLAPMAAIRGIHVVKGKPILSADTMVGIVLSSGAADYFRAVVSNDERATYETKRRDSGEIAQATWTIADAKRAGLITDGGSWSKYPRAMLKARCKAELARDVYPDVLAGCYVDGEIPDDGPTTIAARVMPIREAMQAQPTASPAPARSDVIDAEVIEIPQVTDPWIMFLSDAGPAIGIATGAEPDDIGEAWARMLDNPTRREIDEVSAPLLAVVEKHKATLAVAALRSRMLGQYRDRVAEIKAAAKVTAP